MSKYESEALDLDPSEITFNEKDYVHTGKFPVLREGWYEFKVRKPRIGVSKDTGNIIFKYRAVPQGADGDGSPWHGCNPVLPVAHPNLYSVDAEYKENFDNNRKDYLKRFKETAYALGLKYRTPRGLEPLPPRPISERDADGEFINRDAETGRILEKNEFFKLWERDNKAVGSAAVELINQSRQPEEGESDRPIPELDGRVFYGFIKHSNKDDGRAYLNRMRETPPDSDLIRSDFRHTEDDPPF